VVKPFTGIRRSGKSTLLQLLQRELMADGVSEQQILTINFESMAYANRDARSVYEEIRGKSGSSGGRTYLFLDEIQELGGWETMINSLRVDLDCNLYITGSNAKLLSGELATYLAGRYIEISVYQGNFVLEPRKICIDIEIEIVIDFWQLSDIDIDFDFDGCRPSLGVPFEHAAIYRFEVIEIL
jgi:hypothetical protein